MIDIFRVDVVFDNLWKNDKMKEMMKKKKTTYLPDDEAEFSDDEEPKTKLRQLKEKLKGCQKEKEEHLLQKQRAMADLINYRKRQEQILEEFQKYGQRELLNDLLPVLDALSAGAEKDAGLEKIKKQLEGVLVKNGLKAIAATGEKFNPELHEAVEVAETEEAGGTVIGEIQKGYFLRDKVLRPSKVRVAK